jgi:predicted nucleic acid-binding protein
MTLLRAERGRPLRGVLDTNVVIQWPLLDLSDLPREAAITAVTLAELAAGVHAVRSDRDRAQRLDLLQRVESAFDPLPFDTAAAPAYGRIASAVRSQGRSPRGVFRCTRRTSGTSWASTT